MKTTLFYLLGLLILCQTAWGQSYKRLTTCTNVNTFLTAPTITNLKSLADSIYEGGTIRLDLSKSDQYGEIIDLHPLLGVDPGTSFVLEKVVPSRLNKEKEYRRYQQYHNGIKVEGGGYTVGAFIIPTNPPPDPCEAAYFMLSPRIVSNINIDTKATVNKNSLAGILNGSGLQQGPIQSKDITSELVISPNLSNNCQYSLTWKTSYRDGAGKISYIDAKTSTIIKTVDADMHLNAPTEIYGTQNLNDSEDGANTVLQTPDGRLRVYDFSGFGSCIQPLTNFTPDLIPTTQTSVGWTPAITSEVVYQSFYTASILDPIFEDLGIHFGAINIGADCGTFRAFNLVGSNQTEAFITIGGNGTNSWALFDIMGHEMGHAYINEFLDYTLPGNVSLHEGIANIFGTYGESKSPFGPLDWLMGDDVSGFESMDLEFPAYDCFPNVEGFGLDKRYERAAPIGHWFYIVSEGKGNTIGIGIDAAMNILLETLPLMGREDDYPDMRAAMLPMVDEEFGPCSPEARAVKKAWEQICVGTYDDCYTIAGNNWVCEEDDFLSLYVENASPGEVYQWIFPIEWTVNGAPGNPIGNMYTGGLFQVIDFPKYDWYPRWFTLTVRSPTLGPDYTQTVRVKLIDCLGDDPSCGDDMRRGRPQSTDLTQKEASRLRVINMMGKVVYEGRSAGFDPGTTGHRGILIYQYMDGMGQILRTEKRVTIE